MVYGPRVLAIVSLAKAIASVHPIFSGPKAVLLGGGQGHSGKSIVSASTIAGSG